MARLDKRVAAFGPPREAPPPQPPPRMPPGKLKVKLVRGGGPSSASPSPSASGARAGNQPTATHSKKPTPPPTRGTSAEPEVERASPPEPERRDGGGDASTSSSSSFERILRAFHDARGVKFRVPIFAHRALDLRKVYVEVRARGGHDEVCKHKRWLEVSRTLGVNLTGLTSAGFQMRKNYEACLLAYERKETRCLLYTSPSPRD